MRSSFLALFATAAAAAFAQPRFQLPRVWAHYKPVAGMEKDFADLKANGVGLVNIRADGVEEARKLLELARRVGMKYHISFPDVTEQGETVRAAGFEPVDALMIGGVYRGRAIDRHLFRFTAGPQSIVVEPPVYNSGLPYTVGSGGSGAPKATEPIGHYWPDMPAPVRAEIVVPLRRFDAMQHLTILPAKISLAPADTRLEHDSVTPDLSRSSEIHNRKLYRLDFDLTGFERALLDRVGIAVYWPYHGTKQYWLFGRGTVTANAESTRQALRQTVRRALGIWAEANGGAFPGDIVQAARYGDECFYLAGHTHLPSLAVSYPLWDYSEASVTAFRRRARAMAHPRTWGFPEVYGPEAYAWWMYTLHESAAELARIAREEVGRHAPGLALFRNTTRAGVFAFANDRDGTGPELLTREFDLVHLDPYPVSGAGYSNVIPRDMSYYAGLARRYGKPLVPWMQAHTYSIGKDTLQHVTPEHVSRMFREHLMHGIDAIEWLGYCPDCTFPNVRRDSWAEAVIFHQRLEERRPPRPKAKLAVLRGYRAWALSSTSGGMIRNPADWQLQQLLEVWAVKHGQPYDVFELPPALTTARRAALVKEVATYDFVAGTEEWPRAWVVGKATEGQEVDPAAAPRVRAAFESELRSRGWLPRK